jgi:hypothetical protein
MWEEIIADPFTFALLTLVIMYAWTIFRQKSDSYRGVTILSMAAYFLLRDLTMPISTKFVILGAFYLGLNNIVRDLSHISLQRLVGLAFGGCMGGPSFFCPIPILRKPLSKNCFEPVIARAAIKFRQLSP